MTRSSNFERRLQPYCVRFKSSSCYKIVVNARDEKHAVTLAKRRWFRGSTEAFIPFAGETDGWDAEHEPDHVPD